MNDVKRNDENGVDKRAEVIRGLRELADFLEATPAIPAPAFVSAFVYRSVVSDGPQLDAAALAAVGGVVAVKGDKVEAKRGFSGDVEITVQARAADICVEREVTKPEFVLPEELAPADTAAVTS